MPQASPSCIRCALGAEVGGAERIKACGGLLAAACTTSLGPRPGAVGTAKASCVVGGGEGTSHMRARLQGGAGWDGCEGGVSGLRCVGGHDWVPFALGGQLVVTSSQRTVVHQGSMAT